MILNRKEMVEQAITAFFIILFIIFIIILAINGILSRLIDGVITSPSAKTENFKSEITGLETRDEQKMVNRGIPLKVHSERGYQQNNFQVPSDIPLSQTSYAYYINKYFMNPKINASVDSDMEIVGNANIEKPDFLYDGIWKRNVKSRNDDQRIEWIPTNGINEKRGKLSIDNMLAQARIKPMPEMVEGTPCNSGNFDPYWVCDHESNLMSSSGDLNCHKRHKEDDMVCFDVYLDPLSN